ncbi:MAG: hypothetical protein J6I76_19770 [Oribacterium sp.]|nr:hypothetical protein [Oribacterium sp.]
MNRLNINGYDTVDRKYIARCIRTLKAWGAPLENWVCVDVIDVKGDDDDDVPFSTCELCGCNSVRYEHVMTHDQYFEEVTVGCICAGIMEGDILRARERDRQMKNRSQRRKKFVAKGWEESFSGQMYRDYKDERILLHKCSVGYSVQVKGRMLYEYKGKRITDTLSAAYAAFDVMDPVEDIICGKK